MAPFSSTKSCYRLQCKYWYGAPFSQNLEIFCQKNIYRLRLLTKWLGKYMKPFYQSLVDFLLKNVYSMRYSPNGSVFMVPFSQFSEFFSTKKCYRQHCLPVWQRGQDERLICFCNSLLFYPLSLQDSLIYYLTAKYLQTCSLGRPDLQINSKN